VESVGANLNGQYAAQVESEHEKRCPARENQTEIIYMYLQNLN
jgi:hypothetical protein